MLSDPGPKNILQPQGICSPVVWRVIFRDRDEKMATNVTDSKTKARSGF